jgi:hypothetical protein
MINSQPDAAKRLVEKGADVEATVLVRAPAQLSPHPLLCPHLLPKPTHENAYLALAHSHSLRRTHTSFCPRAARSF